MTRAYHQQGMSGFHAAVAAMKSDWVHVKDREDSDVLAFVFDVGDADPIVQKERQFIQRVRSLARSIEQNPGHSQAEWHSMSNALNSSWFGNGPVNPYGPEWSLLLLYAEIAGVRPTELFWPAQSNQ